MPTITHIVTDNHVNKRLDMFIAHYEPHISRNRIQKLIRDGRALVCGRLGCFFAGCCYGAPCSGPLCITFHDAHSLAPLCVPLFPTQLIESGGEFLIFGALILLRPSKKFDGQLFWFYPLFYAVLRFILEFFRGDAVRGLYFGGIISTSQLIAVLMFCISLAMLWKLSKTGKSKAKNTL